MTDKGLYISGRQPDACGIGFVADIKGNKSYRYITDALTMLENMEHRGATGYEANSGDGAGILFQIPHEFLFDECVQSGIALPESGRYGVGMVFFPQDEALREICKATLERAAEKLNLPVLGYRRVPVNRTGIGPMALSVEPVIEQVIIAAPYEIQDTDVFERKLFILRNYVTHTLQNTLRRDKVGFYVASMSARTIIYKGQLTSKQVRGYFPELSDPRLQSSFALVHSRFATNTFPAWSLAQPFRFIAHNGEINTLQGNLNWLKTAEKHFSSDNFTREEMDMILPVVSGDQSDSACLDNMIELMMHSGRSLPEVLMIVIPEAWESSTSMPESMKAFYEYHASIMEPWDGPAAVCFTNGKMIGATLDRNGLRPARYTITKDGRIILASEAGVLPIAPENILQTSRLKPGKMLVVDMEQGKVLQDAEIKKEICTARPYATWIQQHKIRMGALEEPRVMFTPLAHEQVFRYQKAFGFTTEAIGKVLIPMAESGKEPLGAMGADIPLAVLSREPQHLSAYFKQLFAQVTNPPIDPIRERMVMSLSSFAGNNGNRLKDEPEAAHFLSFNHPVLNNYQLEKIRSIDTGKFQSKTLQAYFRANGKPGALKAGLEQLCHYAEDAVRDGFRILILQDRAIDSRHAAIPSLLATSAVHHHLIRKGLRGQAGLIVEAGDVWEVHHFACLLGFGATAVNPYMAYASILDAVEQHLFKTEFTFDTLRKNYDNAINAGLLKVFSKMGIATLQSYQGAQIFEILGLSREVVDLYFTGAPSRIEGLRLDDIAREVLMRHRFAFNDREIPVKRLAAGGELQWRRKGEFHLFNPDSIHYLQQAVSMNNREIFDKYVRSINNQSERACTLRSLLTFRHLRPSIPIEEVEPAANIYKRFTTGAMSFGSVSWEAHTTLAMAMNRLGGKSNTGEGGEDERRYEQLPNGDSMRSAIKQVASARFGVTARYLTEADEIQIKMAQGAKPGEGGQLPGHKVDAWIARTRHSTPGVGLISPPPHHDIYSIEDLAQLIFDLKNANRNAAISVKLVSKVGIGAIASGVAKAKADAITISGFDGGTGASPVSSIKHAGLPWELGLAEAHQTLVRNKLRHRVRLQTDGQIRTGRDLMIASLLGAEEWGIATAALVVEGCIMTRKCHLNTCPVGIATQNPDLRARFVGKVDHVVRFFQMLTEDLRRLMAAMGFRTVDEMVGHPEFLEMRDNITFWKHAHIDLSRVLYREPETGLPITCTEKQDHGLDPVMDWELQQQSRQAVDKRQSIYYERDIHNTDRATGTLLSNEITKKYGDQGLPEDCIHLKFNGIAGQSFGAFSVRGLTLEIEGAANDYYGKGLSGARLVIYPNRKTTIAAEENIIIGNTSFYGATSGEAYVCGRAGERFCVRNSGARVVVEGVGNHGCEYMTGGVVLILGKAGKNFAAGMSGGIAYVRDKDGLFSHKCNREMVDLDRCDINDAGTIRAMLEKHCQYTGSKLGRYTLDNLEALLPSFVKVFPKEYKAALRKQERTSDEWHQSV